jgi:hypothetical protein
MSKMTNPHHSRLSDPLRWYHRVRARALAALLFVGASFGLASPASFGQWSDADAVLTIVERSVAQDQGGWLVHYRLRYHGPSATVVPAEVSAKVEGWVSNSRVAVHALPRWSALAVAGSSGLSGIADIVSSADESLRCRERATIHVIPDRLCCDASSDSESTPPAKVASSAERPAPPLSLTPGAIVRVRVKLDHVHFLYGDYDPLLGVRAFELHLGTATFHDVMPLDREQYLAQPKYTWPPPPGDRRDTHHFVSAPDSLHLEAHVPGNQYYRFPERPVRYATKMRLRYWYYIATGTEGECRARIAQYKDTPTAWKVLAEGGQEECLNRVGRWVKVERIFRTESDATTLALDFRISGADVGEMWIDDVCLEPITGLGAAGP